HLVGVVACLSQGGYTGDAVEHRRNAATAISLRAGPAPDAAARRRHPHHGQRQRRAQPAHLRVGPPRSAALRLVRELRAARASEPDGRRCATADRLRHAGARRSAVGAHAGALSSVAVCDRRSPRRRAGHVSGGWIRRRLDLDAVRADWLTEEKTKGLLPAPFEVSTAELFLFKAVVYCTKIHSTAWI